MSPQLKRGSQTVTRKALGRVASLGSLYDVRRDAFTGMSLFNQRVPDSILEVTDNPEAHFEYDFKDTYEEKFKKLKVEGHLSLSVLGGLFKLEGSGAYFTDHKRSAKTVKGTLIYQLKTKHESLNMLHKDVTGWLVHDAFNDEFATHVVVGIQWGANVIASMESRFLRDEDQQTMEGILKAQMKKVGELAVLNGAASVSFDETKMKLASELSIRFMADVVPEDELPQTVESLLEIMKKVPQYMRKSNQGKGKQLEYILLPLRNIEEYFHIESRVDKVIMELGETTVVRVEQEFDRLLIARQKFDDLFDDVQANQGSMDEDVVNDVMKKKNLIRIAETEFQRAMSSTLVKVRSGQAEAREMERVLEKNQNNPDSSDGIVAYLNTHEDLRAKLAFLKLLKSQGVLFLARNSSMEELLLKYSNATVYVLHRADRFSKTDLWEYNYNLFCRLLNEHTKEVADKSVVFVVLDEDIYRNQCRNQTGSQACIVQYHRNTLVSDDYYQENKTKLSRNLMKPVEVDPSGTPPAISVELQMACPSSKCKNGGRLWTCSNCDGKVLYDYIQNVYCQCGRATIQTCLFKCNDPYHGGDGAIFLPLNTTRCVLPQPDAPKEINILLMGETGVGKSTFINGFANYITHSTFEEAEREEITALIYSTFSMTDENFETKEVEIGKRDANESRVVGESSTQDCRVYTFPAGDKLLRIIDTPGIGDSRGLDQDNKNFDRILNFISNFEHLNGIGILNKPNNAIWNVYFRFCISQLLTHLHKSAAGNMAFIFTNCRSTFYRVGDTGPILKKALAEFGQTSGIDITLNKHTTYCFDNEAFRFLAALKQGVEFNNNDREQFSKSWEKSVEESLRLLDYFGKCTPHRVKDTITLNNARRILNHLSKPLVAIMQNITMNIKVIEDKKEEITQDSASISALGKRLEIYVNDLVPVHLDFPMTVCTSPGCTRVVDGKVDYNQQCHAQCYLEGVQHNVLNSANLRYCDAISESTGNCTHCGCSWNKHMHITYRNRLEKKKVVDKGIEEILNSKKSDKEKKQKWIMGVEELIAELHEERRKIIQTSASLAQFLKSNAITAYNDAIVDYLDLAINEEKQKSHISGDMGGIQRMEEMKAEYLEEKRIFNDALKNDSNTDGPISVEDVHTKVQDLYKLPHNGEALRKQMQEMEKASEAGSKYQETRYESQKKSTMWEQYTPGPGRSLAVDSNTTAQETRYDSKKKSTVWEQYIPKFGRWRWSRR